MASLRSLFNAPPAGGHGSSQLLVDAGLPPPPTTREMLDDIERCDDDDPVMVFAKQLKKEVRRNSRIQPGNEEEALSSSSSGSDGSESEEEDQYLDAEETSPKKSHKQNPRIKCPLVPNFVTTVNQLVSYPRGTSHEQIRHANDTCNRLRTLLRLQDHSETVLEEVQPKFKRLDAEAKEFVQLCDKVLNVKLEEGKIGQNEDEEEDGCLL